jgi:hypothetical protein
MIPLLHIPLETQNKNSLADETLYGQQTPVSEGHKKETTEKKKIKLKGPLPCDGYLSTLTVQIYTWHVPGPIVPNSRGMYEVMWKQATASCRLPPQRCFFCRKRHWAFEKGTWTYSVLYARNARELLSTLFVSNPTLGSQSVSPLSQSAVSAPLGGSGAPPPLPNCAALHTVVQYDLSTYYTYRDIVYHYICTPWGRAWPNHRQPPS